MAICDLCDNDMTTGATCRVVALHRDGMVYPLPPFNPARGWAGPDGRCGDCGVAPDGYHHVGCDTQRCPCCFGQLISCDCEWRDEDLTPPPPPPPLPSLATFTTDLRHRHHALLSEVAAWSLVQGRPCDLDLAAITVDVLLHVHGPLPWALDRPDVEDTVNAFHADGPLAADVALPDGWAVRLFDLFRFLAATDRLDPAAVPLAVLLEPVRCAGRLDPAGEPLLPGATELEIACQCLLPHDPSSAPGVHQHFVGHGRDGRRLAAVGHVLRPSDDPPVSRLQPLHEYVAHLRADDCPWELWTDELRYAGEIFPTKSAPTLSVYRLVKDRRGRSPLLLDRTGDPWEARPDGRRKVGYRWVRMMSTTALYRTGITDHILERTGPARTWPSYGGTGPYT